MTDNCYRFKNSLPCNDNLLATITEFYEYAKAQGCTDTPQQFFDKFGTMLADAINYNYAQDTDDDLTADDVLADDAQDYFGEISRDIQATMKEEVI